VDSLTSRNFFENTLEKYGQNVRIVFSEWESIRKWLFLFIWSKNISGE